MRPPSGTGHRLVILCDRSIREALDQGRIVVDPLDLALLEPSPLDIRVDHRFRVFAGHRYPFVTPGSSNRS